MAEFTFLELHFEDSNLTANAPYSRSGADTGPGGEASTDNSGSRGGTIVALLVGLVFSLAVAYLVRKKLSSGNTDENGDDSVFDSEA